MKERIIENYVRNKVSKIIMARSQFSSLANPIFSDMDIHEVHGEILLEPFEVTNFGGQNKSELSKHRYNRNKRNQGELAIKYLVENAGQNNKGN